MPRTLEKLRDWWRETISLINQPDEELQLLREQHVKDFQCHICKKPSDGPFMQTTTVETFTDFGFGSFFNFYDPDWNTPTGLEVCKECGQWTCFEHLNHEKICQLCQPT